jgi:hypothetical protein
MNNQYDHLTGYKLYTIAQPLSGQLSKHNANVAGKTITHSVMPNANTLALEEDDVFCFSGRPTIPHAEKPGSVSHEDQRGA